MKRLFRELLLIAMALVLVSCSAKETNEDADNQVKEEKQNDMNEAYEIIEQSDGEKMVKVKQLKPLVEFTKDPNMTYTTTGITNILGKKLEQGLSDSDQYKLASELINAEMTAAFHMGQLIVDEYGDDWVFHEDDWYGVIMYVYTHGNTEECLNKFSSYKELVETVYADQDIKDLIQWCFDNYDPTMA